MILWDHSDGSVRVIHLDQLGEHPFFVVKTAAQNQMRVNCAIVAVLLSQVLSGCAGSEITARARTPEVPSAWPEEANSTEVREDWMASIVDEALGAMIHEALANNLDLARASEAVVQAKSAARIASATRWPSLSAGLDGSRRDAGDGIQTQFSPSSGGAIDSFAAELAISWELDLLLKLRDDAKRATLAYLASQANFEWMQLGVVASVTNAYVSYIEAWHLLRLFGRRLENLSANLDIVDSGYRQGINEALDVYLARSVLEQQRAQVAQQSSVVTESAIRLQRLLGRVPNGEMTLVGDLGVIDDEIPVGLPSELVARRQDLSEAWFKLLEADAAVAVAHKNRFPRISMVARSSDTTEEFDELLQNGNLAWSVSSSLVAPLFDAGRLKAAEQAARSRARQAEQTYLDSIASAFAEVHSAIDQYASLRQRHAAYEASSAHARSAAELSFEQYQKGLTNYLTVLESERRAFDTDTTLVRLRGERLRNRVALHRALGGPWDMPR